jgi:hypothetical protein
VNAKTLMKKEKMEISKQGGGQARILQSRDFKEAISSIRHSY